MSFKVLGSNMTAYAFDMSIDLWPHRNALRALRGSRSVESVAREVGVNRVTWHKWETGAQKPGLENLKVIVETFGCPPELVGYEAPQGWELVPREWLVKEFECLRAQLNQVSECCDKLKS